MEAVFERTGLVLHVHGPDGELIRTTPEHPFFDRIRGWTAAGALSVGDEIRTDTGWMRVADLLDTELYEKVYNIRVADHHTYFVGDKSWGESVWAHNAYINVAFGTEEGLKTFALNHQAKYWQQWTANDFGVSGPWNPTDTTGGTGSLFASAVATAIQKSRLIFFKVQGFDLGSWYTKYLAAGSTIPKGSFTSWELWQLVFNGSYTSRHSSERFVAADGTTMSYDAFKTSAENTLKVLAKQEKTSDPAWQSHISSLGPIKTLMGLFAYTSDMITAL